ncbi:HNH endonuclease [Mycobacterium intracellulare]|uniref:HNH endonuclease n=1 Tax=Mycobacterium intracellulare TaxID=1767 RepID=UPI0013E06CF7|nr:HNH endonuclease signature motif containing protein [Mycobacterium intracellulare]
MSTEDFTLADIAERDQWCCQICGEAVDPDLKWPDTQCATLDHVVPIALDGEHSKANCQLAHANCNRSKGAKLTKPLQLALIS